MNAAPVQVSVGPVRRAIDRSGPRGTKIEPPAGPDTLATLLASTAHRDVAAFTALYDHTCSQLYGVALRVLQDPTTAQEATEEVYLQVWNTAHRYDPRESSPQAWLTTLAHQHAVDRIRAEPGRAARVSLCGNGNSVDFCHYVLDAILSLMVCADANSLDDRQRETIALAYYGGLTCGEVAELLGVPPSTITSRIRLGLTRLGESVGTM